MEGGASGVLVLLGDMPFIPDAAIGAVLERAAGDPARMVQAASGGELAHPVWLPARIGPLVEVLDGDRGVRSLVSGSGETVETVEVAREAAIDLDTPQEYEAALGAGKPGTAD